MTILTKTQIKSMFENGDVPSGTDFANWIDTCITAAETSAQSMTGSLNIAGTLNASVVSAGTISIGNITVDTISASGANFTRVSATTGNFVNLTYTGSLGISDRNYKTNILPMTDVLERIRQLQPVSFEHLANPGVTEYGVIAQDLKEVFPELVKDGDPMRVNHMALIGVLLRAVQQLDEKTRAW